jgi:transposase
LKSTDIQYALLLACLSTMSQNHPTNEIPQKFATEPLEVPVNIILVLLPPYASELNPIENVWAYLRANRLAISVFDTYQEIVMELLRQRHRGRQIHHNP